MRSLVLTAGKIWTISIWKVTIPPKRETAGFLEMLVATKKEQCIVNLGFFEAALI
jgi:hypothetical protein